MISGIDRNRRPVPSWEQVRWQQFAYASIGRLPGTDRGGWGAVASSTTQDVVEAFRGWVSARMETSLALPEFPEPRDLRARQVRLRAGVDERGDALGVLAHSIDAGPDATDRPGNVCTHVAIAPVDTLPRPIELWDSPDWLRPFRAEQTANVTLPRQLRPGTLDAATTFAWATSGEGAVALGWMLDAATHARATGRPLVLATRSPQEAARWIAVLSHLSPRAAGLRFSTFEDVLSVDTARGLGIWIIGMAADAVGSARFDPAEVLVVDPSWQVGAPAGPDGSWQLPGGQPIPPGPWPEVAVELLGLGTQTQDVIEAGDALAATIGTEAVQQAPLYWCSAAALLLADDVEVMERTSLLGSVLSDAPQGAPEEILDRLLDEYVTTGAGEIEIWPDLAAAPNRLIRESALVALVESVLDTGDVAAAPPIPEADRAVVGSRLRTEIAAAMARGPQPVHEYLQRNGLTAGPRASSQEARPIPTATTAPDREPSGEKERPSWSESTRWDPPASPLEVPTMPMVRLEERGERAEPVPKAEPAPRVERVPKVDPVPRLDQPPAMEQAPGVERMPRVDPVPRMEPVPRLGGAPSALSPAEADLLRVLDARADDRRAAALMAEAVLRLRAVLTEEQGLAPAPPVELTPFVAYYLAGETQRGRVGENWARYAGQTWLYSAEAGSVAERARAVLLGEIVSAAVRDPQLWPMLPAELADHVAQLRGGTR